jgi:hypothetical protein
MFYNTTARYSNPDTCIVQEKINSIPTNDFCQKSSATRKDRSSPAATYFLPSITDPINLEYKFINATK